MAGQNWEQSAHAALCIPVLAGPFCGFTCLNVISCSNLQGKVSLRNSLPVQNASVIPLFGNSSSHVPGGSVYHAMISDVNFRDGFDWMSGFTCASLAYLNIYEQESGARRRKKPYTWKTKQRLLVTAWQTEGMMISAHNPNRVLCQIFIVGSWPWCAAIEQDLVMS